MKKLGLLLLVCAASLSAELRQGLSDIAHGSGDIVKGSLEVVTPFTVWNGNNSDNSEEFEGDAEFNEDVRRAKERRDKRRQQRLDQQKKSGKQAKKSAK